MRVGAADRQADKLHAKAERYMHHVHHRIDPGSIQGQTADHVFRRFFEVFVSLLRFHGPRYGGIHGLVGHGNRLMHAADRTGRMKNHGSLGRPVLSVGDGECFMLFQQILHQKTAFQLTEQFPVQIADRFQRRDLILAAHRASQHDDIAQPQNLPLAQEALHQLRKCIKLRDQQIRDPFSFDHALDLLFVKKIKGIDQRYGSACHVQTVKRKYGFCQRRGDQRHP